MLRKPRAADYTDIIKISTKFNKTTLQIKS